MCAYVRAEADPTGLPGSWPRGSGVRSGLLLARGIAGLGLGDASPSWPCAARTDRGHSFVREARRPARMFAGLFFFSGRSPLRPTHAVCRILRHVGRREFGPTSLV